MRKLYTLALVALVSAKAYSADVALVVQKVDNQGAVPGNTYRVFVHVPSSDYTVHAVWGDAENPLVIESTAPFYQHPMGMHTSGGIHPNVVGVAPELAFDSYVTLGYENATDNSLWEVGVDFSSFNEGGEIMTGNGAWFLLPENEKCQAGQGNLIFIGQFTTTGVASGTLNLQGWKSGREGWSLKGLHFVTTDAQVFGCMDRNAANYNAQASFDDGSCENTQAPETALDVAGIESGSGWSVFPNPVRDNLVHIQLNGKTEWSSKTMIEFFDMSGKRVSSQQMANAQWSSNNRITVQQQLAAGTYKIVLTDGAVSESKTLVVAK